MTEIPEGLASITLDAVGDAVLVIDILGTVWYTNRAACALFGYPSHELVGENVETLMPSRLRARYSRVRQHYLKTLRSHPADARLDLYGLRADGAEFPAEIRLTPLEVGGFVVVDVKDASVRRSLEAELVVARAAVDALRELADRATRG